MIFVGYHSVKMLDKFYVYKNIFQFQYTLKLASTSNLGFLLPSCGPVLLISHPLAAIL